MQNLIKSAIILLLIHFSASENVDVGSNFTGNGRIIGGHYTIPENFPYQAGLQLLKTDKRLTVCSGSLITNKYILTAAHCFIDTVKISVGLGVSSFKYLSQSKIYVETTKFRMHSNYNPKIKHNDIGIIELPKPVPLSKLVAIMKLPSTSDAQNTYNGYKAVISGWGDDDYGKTSDILKFLNTVVVPKTLCGNRSNIRDEEMCALGEGKGRICYGDSGGPLVIQNSDKKEIQIGILSYGHKKCPEKMPAVYTRVTSYLDWIKRYTDYKF